MIVHRTFICVCATFVAIFEERACLSITAAHCSFVSHTSTFRLISIFPLLGLSNKEIDLRYRFNFLDPVDFEILKIMLGLGCAGILNMHTRFHSDISLFNYCIALVLCWLKPGVEVGGQVAIWTANTELSSEQVDQVSLQYLKVQWSYRIKNKHMECQTGRVETGGLLCLVSQGKAKQKNKQIAMQIWEPLSWC